MAKQKATAQTAPPAAGGKRIDVHYLTRVEGHGNIVVEIEADGRVSACRWEVPEAPRFFEAMVLGRSYLDVHHIVSRICGICSIGHQLASLQATEDALGIRVSEQTTVLRKLALHAENLQSHLLHIGYLVLPDLLGVDSVIPLAKTHKEALLKLIAARRMANDFSTLIAGRTVHPQSMTPGGWVQIPTKEDLVKLRAMLVASLPNLEFAADLLASLADKIPDFSRPTEYIALVSPGEYPLYWGELGSTHGERQPSSAYKAMTREYCLPQSTAKWSKHLTDSFMVGALARFNLNADNLYPLATKAAAKLGLKKGCTNPFMNTIAQLVECFQSVQESIELIDHLLARGLRLEKPTEVRLRPGKGTGAVEVPRGILYHCYEYDEQGNMFAADCVIPTSQNHANIQKDLEALAPTLSGLPEPEIELTLSMLVRAYDPCISCSTHVLETGEVKPGRFVHFLRKS